MQVRARVVRSLAAAVVLAAAVAAPVLAADHAVTIEGFAYSPGTVTVTVGDTVTWTNRDGASHTATADDGSWDTGGIPSSASDTIRFTTAGEFRYRCTIHPDMTGRVIVQEAGSGSGGGGGGGGATPPATDLEAPTAERSSPGTLPTLAFAILAVAALSGALGWHAWRLRRP